MEPLKKAQKFIAKLSDIMELIIAVAVAAALIIAALRFIPDLLASVVNTGKDTSAFYTFLEEVFFLVIGIEFIKMLCQPDAHNVIEVLLFLIARHMIVGHNGATDNFLSVLSISILFLVERYLKYGTLKRVDKETYHKVDKILEDFEKNKE